jgi:hypothetical protein
MKRLISIILLSSLLYFGFQLHNVYWAFEQAKGLIENHVMEIERLIK